MCFVGRSEERKKLERFILSDAQVPTVIYGPQGSGKTTLLHYLVKRIGELDGWVSVFVDAVRDATPDDLREVLLSGNRRYGWDLMEAAWEVMGDYLRSFNPLVGTVGTLAAKMIGDIVSVLVKKIGAKTGAKIFIAVDDVKIFHDKIIADAYLASLYRAARTIRDEGAERVVILVTTSDGESRKVLGRSSVSAQRLLWNMDYESFKELVDEMRRKLKDFDTVERSITRNSSDQIRRECRRDWEDVATCILWRYTGGNPRSLEGLANESWNPRIWVRMLRDMRVRPYLDSGAVTPRQLESLIDDPDADDQAADTLTQHNLLSPLARDSLLGKPPREDPELGVGRRWAWQFPALRMAAKEALGKTQP